MLIAIFGSVKECHRKGLVCSKQNATSKDHKQFITIVITQRRVNQFAGVGGRLFCAFVHFYHFTEQSRELGLFFISVIFIKSYLVVKVYL